MKAETLRKSILQWAMEGKLVPQLNCEPAVEQIGEAPEEVPFAISEKWKWLRFGDLGTFSSPRRVHKSEWKSKGIPFLRARELANLADTGTLVNELFIDEELFRIRTSKGETPNPGDLVFTAVGTLGKCYVVKSDDIFFAKTPTHSDSRLTNNTLNIFGLFFKPPTFKASFKKRPLDLPSKI